MNREMVARLATVSKRVGVATNIFRDDNASQTPSVLGLLSSCSWSSLTMADRPPPDEDDDFELELEPVDPAILELQRQHAERKTDEAVTRATFDELYEEKPKGEYELKVDWNRLRQFRFTTRHLLIATAVLAILLTIKTQLGGCMSLFVIAMAGIAAGWFAIYRTERREAAERERRREEFLALRARRARRGPLRCRRRMSRRRSA